jgi:hypothetical protein
VEEEEDKEDGKKDLTEEGEEEVEAEEEEEDEVEEEEGDEVEEEEEDEKEEVKNEGDEDDGEAAAAPPLGICSSKTRSAKASSFRRTAVHTASSPSTCRMTACINWHGESTSPRHVSLNRAFPTATRPALKRTKAGKILEEKKKERKQTSFLRQSLQVMCPLEHLTYSTVRLEQSQQRSSSTASVT